MKRFLLDVAVTLLIWACVLVVWVQVFNLIDPGNKMLIRYLIRLIIDSPVEL